MERERATGIIDTLTNGYWLVNRWPAVLLVPVLMDLLLWLGPRLSLGPALLASIDATYAQAGMSDEVLKAWRSLFTDLDLLTMLAVIVPSMMEALAGMPLPFALERPVYQVAELGDLIGTMALLMVGGLALGALYLAPIARAAGTGQFVWEGLAGLAWRSWLRLLGTAALAVVIGLPILIVLSLTTAVPAVASAAMLFATVGLFWLLLYGHFMTTAIILNDVGPIAGLRQSVRVVRENFFTSLGFIGLVLLIGVGVPLVLRLVAQAAIGVPIAVLGHAYVHSGLVAASMLFFRERYALSVKRAQARPTTAPRPPARP